MNYRSKASNLLLKAKEKIGEADEVNISYVALDLRMALECFVYEKALQYEGEITRGQLKTWQPARLLKYILEIDPLADQSTTMSISTEKNPTHDSYVDVGTENLVSLKELQKNYNKLGSFLHTPTTEQLSSDKVLNLDKKKEACFKVIEIIEKVLSSTITNLNIRDLVDLVCNKCGNTFARRIPIDGDRLIANCVTDNCFASYSLKVEETGVIYSPIGADVNCPNKECEEKKFFWRKELEHATEWNCNGCQQRNKIALASVSVENA